MLTLPFEKYCISSMIFRIHFLVFSKGAIYHQCFLIHHFKMCNQILYVNANTASLITNFVVLMEDEKTLYLNI